MNLTPYRTDYELQGTDPAYRYTITLTIEGDTRNVAYYLLPEETPSGPALNAYFNIEGLPPYAHTFYLEDFNITQIKEMVQEAIRDTLTPFRINVITYRGSGTFSGYDYRKLRQDVRKAIRKELGISIKALNEYHIDAFTTTLRDD